MPKKHQTKELDAKPLNPSTTQPLNPSTSQPLTPPIS